MIGLSVAHVFSVCYIQYGVELDVPAATILSMFGLRAQVISLFFNRPFYRCSGLLSYL